MNPAVTQLRIIHTNDIHSHFELLPKISSAIQSLKQPFEADQLLVLDIGDHMDRMSVETEGSGGRANIEVMNYTGYDFVTIGNNEGLTFDSDQLRDLYGEHADFSVTCANMFELDKEALPEWMAPYQIVHKAGMKIAVIGVTIDFVVYYRLLGWDVQDPLEIVDQWVRKLRSDADFIIVMSHLGINRDRQLAERTNGIDLILGGHTHHLLEKPERLNGTAICAAGRFGTHVGYVDVQFHKHTRSVISIDGGCVQTADYEDDPGMAVLVKEHQIESRRQLKVPIAVIPQALSIDWNEESQLGNLLSSGIRKWTQAEIAIVNSGQILQSLLPGKVTWEMILEMCPSPINPCRMQLTGASILQALEESLLPEYQNQWIKGFGFRGKVLGQLCLSGLNVYYNPNGKPMRKIEKAILENGELLQENRRYSVGTLDMFTFGIGYLSLKEGAEVEYFLPEFIRDVLARQLADRNEVLQCSRKHWIAIC